MNTKTTQTKITKKSKFEQEFVNTVDAAQILGVTRYTIRTWILDRKLAGKKVGGRYFIPLSEIEKLKN